MTQEKFWDLRVFKEAHKLVLLVYRLTGKFPPVERHGLVSQTRRAAVSVVANLVEGTKRRGRKERIQFHNMADGSLEEVKYFAYLAKELKYMTGSDYQEIVSRTRMVGGMLGALTRSLRTSL